MKNKVEASRPRAKIEKRVCFLFILMYFHFNILGILTQFYRGRMKKVWREIAR